MKIHRQLFIVLIATILAACMGEAPPEMMEEAAEAAQERGPNNGIMLRDGDFALELAIFETGVPPEYRAWVTNAGDPVSPNSVDLEVRLIRLGDVVDQIGFNPEGDYLRGDTVIYEPHSFTVSIDATMGGRTHSWEYDSFEGRTQISAAMAEAFGIETEIAGSAVLEETATIYGSIVPNTERVREVRARFDGAIRGVDVALGETVSAGQTLATVESNESLNVYMIEAPIGGVVTERIANAGEQTAGRSLFTIVDTTSVWVELAVFPGDRSRVLVGADVEIMPATGGESVMGTISYINVMTTANQAVNARVVLDNSDGMWPPGAFVTADVKVGEYEVPLAVRREGTQSFRDFTVVYAQIGDQYEVRMLDLGRQAGDWAEVLGGLEPGTRYVTTNSYVLKADIEKAGAAHDH